MKRLSISELKAQKGALVKIELYMGGADDFCYLGKNKPLPHDKLRN